MSIYRSYGTLLDSKIASTAAKLSNRTNTYANLTCMEEFKVINTKRTSKKGKKDRETGLNDSATPLTSVAYKKHNPKASLPGHANTKSIQMP